MTIEVVEPTLVLVEATEDLMSEAMVTNQPDTKLIDTILNRRLEFLI